jgi:hypothetical protein
MLLNDKHNLVMIYYSADMVKDLEFLFDTICNYFLNEKIEFARIDLSKNEMLNDFLESDEEGKVVFVTHM